MTAERRANVLRLYRQILKAGRFWEGSAEEKTYIFEEARKSFRWNSDVEDDTRVDFLIREGEGRLEYATHYKIPYPRLEHANQFHRRYFLRAPQSDPAGPDEIAVENDQNSRLAAAAERLKKRHHNKEESPPG